MDLNRPHLIEFLIENGFFLLAKAHVFGAKWTARPPTSEAFFDPLVTVKRSLDHANGGQGRPRSRHDNGHHPHLATLSGLRAQKGLPCFFYGY